MALHAGTLGLLENTVGVSDACLLEPLTEDAFIENLRKRFHHDQIYVSIVHVLRSTCGDFLSYGASSQEFGIVA